MDTPAYKAFNSHTQRKQWSAAYARHQYRYNPTYRAKSKLRHYTRVLGDDDAFIAMMAQHKDDPVTQLLKAQQIRRAARTTQDKPGQCISAAVGLCESSARQK